MLTDLLVMLGVLFGLAGMLAHTTQKVFAVSHARAGVEQAGPHRAQLP
jgi:hypothetical protein